MTRRQLAEFKLENNEVDASFLAKALDQYSNKPEFGVKTNYGYTFGHMWIVRDIAKYHPTKANVALAQDMDDRIRCATAV